MSEMWKRLEGQVVNKTFHLRQYLGGSQHGGVFLTEQADRKNQKAAIKLIPIDPSTAELQLSRWRQASKLIHPHLLRLYHMGRCQITDIALLFLVMEYAEENLSQVLPHRPLTASEAHDTFLPTVDALGYLHREGFAHGRVKPSNIMAVGDQIKLTSDGLWWMGEPSIEIGQSSPYDPPEKATTGISPAGDIWSLGLTLFQALTAHLPAVDSSGDVSTSNLAAPFRDITRECLRRDPRQRSTIAQIAVQLEGGKSPQTQPDQLTLERLRAVLSQPRFIMPSIAVALLLIAILTVPHFVKPRADVRPTVPTTSTKPLAQPAPEKPKAGVPLAAADKSSPVPTLPPLAEPTSNSAVPTPGDSKAIHEVVPAVPESARNTIQGTVRVNVRVEVAPSGNVTVAKFDSTGPSKYFARLAMQAAENWKFTPLQAEDARREWILRFEFQRTGTHVRPFPVTP